MNNDEILILKKDIVAIGRLLWEKDLVSGLNGNISVRVDENRILLTATRTCLGLLKETDILLADLEGTVLEGGELSTERLLHIDIYRNFPSGMAVIHTHTTYTNAYFLENDLLTPRIFESKFYIGEVKSVPQLTPSVTDTAPVIDAMKSNNIVVLKNHGVVAMGKNLFDCFLLIQCLEESVKTAAISRLFKSQSAGAKTKSIEKKSSAGAKTSRKYKLFSQEQIKEIVKVVNADAQMQDLGKKTAMNMELAVQLNETGQVHSFKFENGKIVDVRNNDTAEFLISAPENIWRAVFNQEIDPFVATTQKKMNLRGDFGRISKWYAPCSRIFELWRLVPVE